MGVVSSLIAGTIGTAALMAGAGTAVGVSAAAGKKEARSKKAALLRLKGERSEAAKYALGAPERAKQTALEEEKKQRRIRKLAGGETILTSEKPVGKTVLG